MPELRRIGVILAAGRGGRMGGTKQLKPWRTATDEKPLIAAAYDAIRPICNEMVVVVGDAADEVAAALGERPFHRTMSDSDDPMFESIRAGIRGARRLDPKATIVLQPGDHPEVHPSTLELLKDASIKSPIRAIIPQYGDRGGHPVLIPADLAAQLVQTDCPAGLGQYWIDHPEMCVRVPVNDPTIVRDIDTPADLA